ncbi:para-aminobenzoate synthetase component 1 [Acinetobacter calcoaceticus]|uniref:Para-aminobenzoate synthetase component 1 n=1 Tax=Acinetobacter calcoaceticus TaxID=471 RepID=A0A4V2QZC3_ACICA|nr:para-aminobenzoate synthetase component 1 [Acinetobacter calcoaceticus]
MTITADFKRILSTPTRHTADILSSLQTFFGCVYLENHHSPVIAVLPDAYCSLVDQKIHLYNKTNLLHYSNTSILGHIGDFVKFTQYKSQNSDKTFSGGFIGFIDYNFAANQQVSSPASAQPPFYIGRYSTYLKLEEQQWVLHSSDKHAEALYQLIQTQLNAPIPDQTAFRLLTPCAPVWSKTEYKQAFESIHHYIRAGDCYQINLTQKFSAQATGNLLDTAKAFWQLTDAPYSAYLKFGGFELLSCSPELFIEFGPNRQLITKPIKGTMPRDADPSLDQKLKQQLIDSEKDQAENLMIVDLLRNDLSVYAEIGSVKTPKLFEIESFNQVHHMVSEINATLCEDVNPFELLLSALPGGSITGAPKIRAMQIIEELEIAPRGAYCGSMGYFNFDGTGSWNILIRSIQKYQDQLSIWAGGGITIASDCDAEYQECYDKVSAMLNLLNNWNEQQKKQTQS